MQIQILHVVHSTVKTSRAQKGETRETTTIAHTDQSSIVGGVAINSKIHIFLLFNFNPSAQYSLTTALKYVVPINTSLIMILNRSELLRGYSC